MPDIHQIYAITNSLVGQALGTKDLEPTDTTFVSIGRNIISNDNNKDAFYKVLFDRIGRTVVAIREIEDDTVVMDREPLIFAAMVQKLSFKMVDAQENPAWRALTADHTDPFKKSNMTFKQTIFQGVSTWEVPGTTPDDQIRTAFLNAAGMMAFMDGIFMNMKNSMQARYNSVAYAVRASAIAAVIHSGNPVCYVNLLSTYNTFAGTSLTFAKALTDLDFLKFSGRLIKLYSKRMEKMSTTFNIAGWERRTPKSMQVFEVLAELSTAYDTYLQSDTWHNELTKLDNYTVVPYWQGSGNDWSLQKTSGIDVVIEYEEDSGTINSNVSVNTSGVVAVIRDIDAIATTIDNRKTTSIWNPHDEYTNYWYKANIGYMRDVSENMVVFTMSENAAEGSTILLNDESLQEMYEDLFESDNLAG